jgi:hypothetical protein
MLVAAVQADLCVDAPMDDSLLVEVCKGGRELSDVIPDNLFRQST